MAKNKELKVCLWGHPYAPIGRGEDVRCSHRALRSVAVKAMVGDIYQLITPNIDEMSEFSAFCLTESADINIFHINGDEVEQAMAHLSYTRPWSGYNIIYPTWELSHYPREWATQLDRFDEIWAPSLFISDTLNAACKKPVFHMPLACEPVLNSFLSRRYFGIPEAAYCFLFFFDMRSYVNRKNPRGVINAFKSLLAKKPYAKTVLILKVHGSEQVPEFFEQMQGELEDIIDHMVFLNEVMCDNEVKNLVRCCDCFVSLHRAEGYGRGVAEAMCLGKPVIATGYSGNMDFMNSDVSYCLDYKLIPVRNGEYPHFEDQVWADPDVEQAAKYMLELIENPEVGRQIGKNAKLHMATNFSYRQIGMIYRNRIDEIQNEIREDAANAKCGFK